MIQTVNVSIRFIIVFLSMLVTFSTIPSTYVSGIEIRVAIGFPCEMIIKGEFQGPRRLA